MLQRKTWISRMGDKGKKSRNPPNLFRKLPLGSGQFLFWLRRWRFGQSRQEGADTGQLGICRLKGGEQEREEEVR